MEKPNNHICLNPAGVSAMQVIEVQADSIEGEEIFGPGAQGYIKLKLEGNTVGQFPKVHVEGWWRSEENEENEENEQ